MIVAVEIIVGNEPTPEVDAAAALLVEACHERDFPAEVLAEPTAADNRLCLYLTLPTAGYDIERLLDVGVRRNAFARLDHTQYLVRSWRGQARLHVAIAARSGAALRAAARDVAERIVDHRDFSRLDLQGPSKEQAAL